MESLQEVVCGLLTAGSHHLSGPMEVRIPLKYAGLSPSTHKQRYPSGQRGWDEVPVRSASQVRILPSAPTIQPRIEL